MSPFGAIGTPLGAGTGLVPALLTVGVIAVGLAVIGFAGLRRRDLGG